MTLLLCWVVVEEEEGRPWSWAVKARKKTSCPGTPLSTGSRLVMATVPTWGLSRTPP